MMKYFIVIKNEVIGKYLVLWKDIYNILIEKINYLWIK